MARRGRFGRRPRSTGNLTALVASLYREQRQAEDRTMFDAYENGGLVDGKPVDDARMRAYIATRRDSMGQDDPLWDEWNNRLIQLDFKIGEDKITLAFQQGNVGAGAVAAYYRKQLSSIPRDSAFYREVASRAAQWAKAAGGAARGAARSRLSSALGSKADAAARTQLNYFALEDIIRQAAVRAGILAGNQELTDADATRLRDFLAAGVQGPKGLITFEDWQRATVEHYKSFDSLIAINEQLNRGTKDLKKQKTKFFNEVLVRVNTIDDRAAYEEARDAFIEATRDAQGDPNAILAAAADYAKTLQTIHDNAAIPGRDNANDPEFLGGLKNEIEAVTTGKPSGYTVADLQSNEGEGVRSADGDETAAYIAETTANAKMLDSGQAYYGQAEFGGKLGVVPYAPGAALDPFGRKGLGPDTQQAVLNINGKPVPVMLKGQEITAVGLVDPGGNAVSTVIVNGANVDVDSLSPQQINDLLARGFGLTDGQPVGYVFTQGGKTTYGVIQPDGSLSFSLSNPFVGPVGRDGTTLVVGTAYNPNGDVVPTMPPTFDTGGGMPVYVDDSVSPASLRDLAANAESEADRAKYETLAEQKQRGINAETAYMERDRKGLQPPDAPFGFIGDALGNVQEALRNAVLTQKEDDTGPVAPPQFGAKKASGPLLPPAPPPVVPSLGGAPGAFRPPPPPKGVSPELPPGKAKDDKYQPPPPPKPKGGGQGGGKDVL